EGSFVIIVKDNGYGIKKSEQKNIFTKFYRASNVRKVPAEGTGLGLYLVKNMLDHTGGTIWYESDESKGSSFYVALPLTGMKPHKGREGGKKLETLSTASIESEILNSAGEEVTAKKEKSTGKGKKKR
ncbi:MAG: HAMP domain-containing sensor histidine kinase, partial [Candidatus Peregrinibacteria bacterium]|nr:HAMP domain-containing sensor histidine kinase [Candidatus Peregrinibacteria bacterium]